MQLEDAAPRDGPVGVARFFQGLVDGQLLISAVGGNGHGVPNLQNCAAMRVMFGQ